MPAANTISAVLLVAITQLASADLASVAAPELRGSIEAVARTFSNNEAAIKSEALGQAAAEMAGIPVTDAVEVLGAAAKPVVVPELDKRLEGDVACDALETYLKNVVKDNCNLQNNEQVTCVWGNTDTCSYQDYCKPSVDCGFFPENPLFKANDYSCSNMTLVPFRSGIVQCEPSITPLGVGLIVAVVLLGCCCCASCIYCCCKRR